MKSVKGISIVRSMPEIGVTVVSTNDLNLLQKAGYSATPKNAPSYIKNKVNFITQKKGGDGAFREFIEKILDENNLIEKVLKIYLESH